MWMRGWWYKLCKFCGGKGAGVLFAVVVVKRVEGNNGHG